jgi:hypothetical protein
MMEMRSTTVEPVFGQIKHGRGGRHFSRHSLVAAGLEFGAGSDPTRVTSFPPSAQMIQCGWVAVRVAGHRRRTIAVVCPDIPNSAGKISGIPGRFP